MRSLVLVPTLFLLSCAPAIDTPEQLVQQMKAAYGEAYLSTLTFTQRTVHTGQDGTQKEETWYESYRAPGALSIRFDPVEAGNGILFADDSVYSYEAGVMRMGRPMIHPLLLLGFDVYVLPVEQTMAKLADLGYDLAVLDEGVWNERPVYIVGALAGDDSTKQFWVDKERLVLLRTLEPRPRMTMEVQFNDYRQVDGSWVAAEVLFLRDGQIATEEYYSDIKANVEIDEREFDPETWMAVAGAEE